MAPVVYFLAAPAKWLSSNAGVISSNVKDWKRHRKALGGQASVLDRGSRRGWVRQPLAVTGGYSGRFGGLSPQVTLLTLYLTLTRLGQPQLRPPGSSGAAVTNQLAATALLRRNIAGPQKKTPQSSTWFRTWRVAHSESLLYSNGRRNRRCNTRQSTPSPF